MLSGIARYLEGLDRRYRVLVTATGIYSWAMTLPATYAQLYVVLLGANPLELGGLSSMANVVGAFAAIPAGWFMARHGLKKMLMVGFSIFAASALIYAVATSWYALIPATLLSAISPALVFPVADIIIIEVSGKMSRATAMGISRVVWNMFGLLAPIAATLLVATFGGISVKGIRPLFLVQLTATVGALLLLLFKLDDSGLVSSGSRQVELTEVVGGLRLLFAKGEYAAWMLAMSVQRFSMAISFSFLPLWFVAARGADEYLIGAVNTAGLVALLLSSIPAGTLSDRIGWLKVFLAFRSMLYLGTLIALALPHQLALVAAGFLGITGFMYGAGASSFIPFITAFWEASPPDQRGTWYAASSLLGGLVAMMAPIIGGVLWELGYRDMILLLPLAVDGAGVALTVAAAKLGGSREV